MEEDIETSRGYQPLSIDSSHSQSTQGVQISPASLKPISENVRSTSTILAIVSAVMSVVLLISLIFLYSLSSAAIKNNNDEIYALKRDFEKLSVSFRDFTEMNQKSILNIDSQLKILNSNISASNKLLVSSVSFIKGNLTDMSVHQSNVDLLVSSVSSRVDDHDKLLVKLTNRTSNAEVLDKLSQTQSHLISEMDKTKLEVSMTLQSASQNVTRQLDETHNELDHSVVLMKAVVVNAEDHIYKVQSNVTAQLADMTEQLNATVVILNTAVAAAKSTIHDEVSVVKNKIEQYVLATNVKFAAENDFVKYQLAGFFTLLGCLISLWHMTSHLRHYEKPDVQRRIMAVLWMVPIYGVTSWLSLVFDSMEFLFGAIRDFYEAYAIYTFIALLIAVLEDGKGLTELLRMLTKHVIEERRAVTDSATATVPLKEKPVEHIRPPCPCCYVYHKPSSVAAAWLYQCRLMAMQFVFLKPVLTAIPLIITMSGVDYHNQPLLLDNRSVNWNAAKIYVVFFQNVSVAVAFYGLLSFYHGTEKDLAWCDPWPKFLCIKGVVFMTFWQGLALQMMSSTGVVDERMASQIQNLLICVEMLLASIAHFYIFPYQEWQLGYKKQREKTLLIRDTLALRDFYRDMRQMVTPWERPTGMDQSSVHDINQIIEDKEVLKQDIVAILTADDEQALHKRGSKLNDQEDYRTRDEQSIIDIYEKSSIINPLFPNCDHYYQMMADELGTTTLIEVTEGSSSLFQEIMKRDSEETTFLLEPDRYEGVEMTLTESDRRNLLLSDTATEPNVNESSVNDYNTARDNKAGENNEQVISVNNHHITFLKSQESRSSIEGDGEEAELSL